MSKTKGHVLWFNDAKGYGFIHDNNTCKEVFVHYTSIQGDGFKTLAEGQSVTFDLINGERGLLAQNVCKE